MATITTEAPFDELELLDKEKCKTAAERAEGPERQLFNAANLDLDPNENPAYQAYLVAKAKLQSDIDGVLHLLSLHSAVARNLTVRGSPTALVFAHVADLQRWSDILQNITGGIAL